MSGTPGCNWTAQSTASWLSLTTGTGSSSGSVYFSAGANSTGTSRTAYITLARQNVAILQPSTACTYNVSSSRLTVPATAASGTIAVITTCPVAASTNTTWITATALSQNSVAYSVTANTTGQTRSAVLTVGNQQVQVSQAASSAPIISLAPGGVLFGSQPLGSRSKALTSMRNWPPSSITTDQFGSYPQAIGRLQREGKLSFDAKHRTCKYLNNIIEADHGALKQVIRPTRGFQTMKTASATIKAFEVMRMIRRGHCLTCKPHAKDEVRFVNKLFDVYPTAA